MRITRIEFKIAWIAALVVVAALAVAACGGGDDDDGDEFVADANAICRDAAAQVGEVYADISTIESAEEFVDNVERISEVEDPEVEELRALEPPDDDADRFEEYVSQREQAAALAEEAIAAGEQDDRERVNELTSERGDLQDQASATAAEVGLDDCDRALGEESEQELREVIERSATSAGEEDCGEIYTRTYIDDAFGGDLEACATQGGGGAESVEIGDISGVDEAFASASADLTGGRFGGQSFNLLLVHQEGSWKITSIEPGSTEPPE